MVSADFCLYHYSICRIGRFFVFAKLDKWDQFEKAVQGRIMDIQIFLGLRTQAGRKQWSTTAQKVFEWKMSNTAIALPSKKVLEIAICKVEESGSGAPSKDGGDDDAPARKKRCLGAGSLQEGEKKEKKDLKEKKEKKDKKGKKAKGEKVVR